MGFEYLSRFVMREGHALVPNAFSEAGYRLGRWVGTQRGQYKKGKLAKHHIVRLEEIEGWVWAVFDSDR